MMTWRVLVVLLGLVLLGLLLTAKVPVPSRDTFTNSVATVDSSPFSNPISVAVNPNGRFAYVVNVDSGIKAFVSVIDTASNRVIATVPVGRGAGGMAVTPDGRFVYVASSNFYGTVSVIDTTSNSVVATIR
jgi:YVTN family beta-propeller protein